MIVFTSVVTVVALVIALMLFRVYRPLRRTAQNLEVISEIMAERVTRPLSNIPFLMEIVRYAVGWVRGFRQEKKESDDGDAR